MTHTLWGSPHGAAGNAIADLTDATAMRRLVQELLDLGWDADELLLTLTDDSPCLTTVELLAWLAAE